MCRGALTSVSMRCPRDPRSGITWPGGPMPSDLTTLDPDVLAQVVGALVVMTPEGQVVSWDRGAEILFGFSPEEALQRSIFELVIPADRAAETREQMQKALVIGAAVYESERSRKDGSSLPVGVSM